MADFALADVVLESGPGDGGAFQFGEGGVHKDAVEVGGVAGGQVSERGGHGGVDLVGDGEVRVVGHVGGVLAGAGGVFGLDLRWRVS